jgi:DNA-binding SARP family transcriptional activator
MSEPTHHVVNFPAASVARFALRCWGDFSLIDRLQHRDVSPRGRKARAAIAYLATMESAAAGRSRLASLLWSERGDDQARGSLRQTLHELKSYAAGGAPLIEVERDQVRLNRLIMTSDLLTAEELARDGDLETLARMLAERPIRLYADLDGLDPAFDEWLEFERHSREDRQLTSAVAAAEGGLERGDARAVSALAAQLQRLDPTNETFAQIAMRADHGCGDQGGVARTYRRLGDALKRDLGIAPSPATEALYRELMSQERPSPVADPTPPPAEVAAPPPPRPAPMEAEPAHAEPEAATPAASRKGWRRGLIVAAVAVVLAGAGAAAWLLREIAPSELRTPPRLQIAGFTPLEADPEIRDYAARLSDQVAAVLTDNLVGVSLADARDPRVKSADLRLDGTVSREGGRWRVKVALEDPQAGVTLWAQEFQRTFREGETLEYQVAGAAGDALSDTVDALQEKTARRNPRALALYVQSIAALKDPRPMNLGTPSRLLEDAVAGTPDFVGARATLAMVLATESEGASGETRERLAERARREALKAIRTDASSAAPAYDALYLLAREAAPTDLVAAQRFLDEGIAKAPRFPFLYLRRCRLLVEAGLARDALPDCQQALARSPFASFNGITYASDIYALGAPEIAASVTQKSLRFHPDDIGLRRMAFSIAAFSGRPDEARAILHEPFDAPPYDSFAALNPEGAKIFELYFKARKSGTAADVDAAIAALAPAGRPDPRYVDPQLAVFAAAALGRPDAAFALLDSIARGDLPDQRLTDEYLFGGSAAPLWRDRRFWPLAAKAGYVAYWRARNTYPEFCSAPSAPYDCRTGAAKTLQPQARAG